MTYLARDGEYVKLNVNIIKCIQITEGANSGEISWKFDFSKANLVIKNFRIRCEKQTYENGLLNVDILTDDGKTNPIGCSAFTIKATLSGGSGDCSWQHSQLFRQSLNSNEYPFELNLEF